eukprot:evm.model.scf_3656.1 EVM.evm.TU.scf_3656.1   scf_3656:5763-8094(-)
MTASWIRIRSPAQITSCALVSPGGRRRLGRASSLTGRRPGGGAIEFGDRCAGLEALGIGACCTASVVGGVGRAEGFPGEGSASPAPIVACASGSPPRRWPGRASPSIGRRPGGEKIGVGARCAASVIEGVGRAEGEPDAGATAGGSWRWKAVRIVVPVLLVGGILAWNFATRRLDSLKIAIQASGLWRSGFGTAASLVFLSEIGDKTFFIAGLLAMQLGRLVAFLGAVSALALMSIVSVGLGAAFEAIPAGLRSSMPMGEYAVVGLLIAFGVSMLREALAAGGEAGAGEGELAGAREAVGRAEEAGGVAGRTPWQAFLQVASLVFVGEWGDRSMLATIAMAATRSPVAVVAGATLAHIATTAIAVVAGCWAAQYISERLVKVLGGVSFLAFAVGSLVSLLLGAGA